ncbi:MAG: threonine--tRNA ligase [bacterium]|jgi:threonyl-tRNA synthetase|nr:threonine--tRNA ligase [Deltaproteobacteria bacterium]|tara:strand:- start:153 stop:1928 length:1776 start_codon:yes stop_codon:yes gene_type:complete
MKEQNTNSNLYKIRHSLAHILAQAVLEIRPNAKLGFGPPIDSGFYYDFDLDEPLSAEDLPKLEKRMRHIIKTGQVFEREELDQTEIIKRLSKDNQSYKIEQVEDLSLNNEPLSLYHNGPFWDLCEGPHVKKTSDIPKNCFTLETLAGAYWKGSEKNNMMQRVYGLAFETVDELKKYQEKRRLAMERDHRKLNRKQNYYTISDEVGKGLPLWLPNGTVIREELEKLAKETEFLGGYKRVSTPHITREELLHTSGHLPYYEESMFPPMEMEGERLFLKPMNCPHHHMIFKAEPRSYRDLPLRLAEYGTCYRYEQSGELAGLLRVRCMTMNDAHIYCTPEQAKEEFIKVMNLHKDYYKLFGLRDFWMRLSLAEENAGKFVDEPELWKKAEKLVTEAMDEVGIPYEAVRGEAAFYGPKIDFQVTNVVGREETASTNQLDLVIGKRFGLSYIASDNEEHTPIIIHRAPLGTHERFVAFLIEHYGGAFPTWLAPLQVRVIPVASAFNEYANSLNENMYSSFIRTEIDDSHDSFSKKIRSAAITKIPNLLIVGENEQANKTVTWQRYGSKERQTLAIDTFLNLIQKEILQRKDWRKTV